MELHQDSSVRSKRLPSAYWVGQFQCTVEEWFAKSGRDFPWRQSSNSFHVLVAEVLLRRTQANRIVRPYLELIERYPDTWDMAEANVDWLREWFRPLGLVNRANLLVHAAKTIVEKHGGEVPRELSQIENLPGLGLYSARAILCLAHGGAVPMIDESSGRLLRRLLGLASTRPAYSDRRLLRHAEALIPHGACRPFNLGLLDIAAAYCHVNSPDCVHCPLSSLCSQGRQVNKITLEARAPAGGEISNSDVRPMPTLERLEKESKEASVGRRGEE